MKTELQVFPRKCYNALVSGTCDLLFPNRPVNGRGDYITPLSDEESKLVDEHLTIRNLCKIWALLPQWRGVGVKTLRLIREAAEANGIDIDELPMPENNLPTIKIG